LTDHGLHPLADLMRRYAFGYTACHDFDACRQIMVDDYVLRMGAHVLRGREEAYIPATVRQYRQFPGLGFTVHDFVMNGDRCALRFSEHGRSVLRGTEAVWHGISLYRWDGNALLECRVEQDYFARRRQLDSGQVDPLTPPHVDPWAPPPQPPDPRIEAVAEAWLFAGGLADPGVLFDDEPWAQPCRAALQVERIDIQDLFSAGSRVVFHTALHGRYIGGLSLPEACAGRPAVLWVAGVAEVEEDRVVSGRVVSDRLGLQRRLGCA
jgi:predicted ester cyclase